MTVAVAVMYEPTLRRRACFGNVGLSIWPGIISTFAVHRQTTTPTDLTLLVTVRY